MRTCTPNPHVALQLLQSEVTHVAGVQFPGAAGGVGQEGRPKPASKTTVGLGGGRASVGLPRTVGLGEGVVAGVVVASGVGPGVGSGVEACEVGPEVAGGG